MIIKSTRIKADSGHGAIANHVLRGRENESVHVLRGDEQLLAEAVQDAEAWKRAYSIRHLSISPEQATTRQQALAVVNSLGQEFGFDPNHIVLVEHQKKRADGQSFDRHWHALVPEVNPTTGQVLSSRHSYARQEKIARLSEIKFGHSITQGRHNKAAVAALRGDGLDDIADKLEAAGITTTSLPNASYTSEQHQIAKRQGLSLPKVREAVKLAWQRSDSRQSFEAALDESALQIADGDKPNLWIVQGEDGQFLGALHRLAGVKKHEAAARMTPTPEPEPPKVISPQSSPKRVRRKGVGGIKPPWVGKPIKSKKEATGLAYRWQQQGFKAIPQDRGVLIHGNGWQIADAGNRCTVSHPTPDAIKALVSKGKREWNGQIEAYGSQEFLAKCWLECQRQGVEFSVKDQPNWTPPEDIQRQWEREQKQQDEKQLPEKLSRQQIEYIKARLEGKNAEQARHQRTPQQHHQPEPEPELPAFRM